MIKTPVKFQKDWYKTVGGVVLTRFPLQTRNHAKKFEVKNMKKAKKNKLRIKDKLRIRFVLVWFCRFPLPLGVWEGLRFVIVAFPGFFSYSFL